MTELNNFDEIFISLGWNCDGRFYIKNNLKLSSNNGYKTCPFDLCMTSYDSLYRCIETNFDHFFDDLRLIPGENANGDRTNAGVGKLNITNSYNMIFNHEGSTHSHLFKNGTHSQHGFEFIKLNEFTPLPQRITYISAFLNLL